MRLLTHNTMRCNIEEAKGNGFPLRINAVEVKVVENPEASAVTDRDIDFVKHILPTLDWPALVKVSLCLKFFARINRQLVARVN
jgi:hypothetical protein